MEHGAPCTPCEWAALADRDLRAIRMIVSFIAAGLSFGVFRYIYHDYLAMAPELGQNPRCRIPLDACTPEFGSRVVSSLHCVTAVTLAVLYLAGLVSEGYWLLCLNISVGYLVHDLLLVSTEARVRNVNDVIHHVAFITVITFADSYPYQMARGILAETSLPFLYAGWAMLRLQLTHSYKKTFWTCSVVGVLLFFIFRVVNFTQLVYYSYYHASMLVTCAGGALAGLNYYWFAKLVKIALKVPSPCPG